MENLIFTALIRAACILSAVGCSTTSEPSLPADATVDATSPVEVVAEVAEEARTEVEAEVVERTPPRLGPPSPEQVSLPEIEGPIDAGNGEVVLIPPIFDLSVVGYVEEEFFLSGEATSYTSAEELTEDGFWEVVPDSQAPYATRVVVRIPTSAAKFDGTVVVEWFNVSGGLDAAPDWTFTHNQLIRAGSIWVGVSAQEDGIEGGGNSMGAMMALKNVDSVRYGPLDHPGDDFSYDIFSQAGAAVWFAADEILGGLKPSLVIAAGESQSAFRLSTYINGIAPLVDVFDGYFVHSRGAKGAPLGPGVVAPSPCFTRTDLEVPVLVLSTETDLVDGLLGYVHARQPDGPWFAGWEVAGTAHVDAYGLGIGDDDDGTGIADLALFEAMLDPPSTGYFGVFTCDLPINTGPQTYVARAAMAALVGWAREGEVPPTMPRLELTDSLKEFVRDDAGNAVGGIRTPHVDVPLAALSGLGQAGGSFCILFGTTAPLATEELAALYPDHETFTKQWNLSLDAAVTAGAILEADKSNLQVAAESYSVPR